MAITAADIHNVSFSLDRKGYDVDEVDVFLEHVAEEIDAMNRQIQMLEEQAAAPLPAPAIVEDGDELVDDSDRIAEIERLQAQVADLQSKLNEKSANDSAISQALIVAQRSADELLANARVEASNIIKDADEEADRIIGKAESDRLRIVESIKQLETDRTEVRAGYREMLSNFMSDAQKKLAEIDGDARRATASAQARNDASAGAYTPAGGAYTPAEPQVKPVTPPAPSASGFIDKDFSGYGAAADDFAFDDID